MRGIFFFIFFISSFFMMAQKQYSITGDFPQASNKIIVLKGFETFGEVELGRAEADALGKFKLYYSSDYIGAAELEIKDLKTVIVLLNKENFEVKWGNIENFDDLQFTSTKENEDLFQGMQLYKIAEQKKVGLSYLMPLYSQDLPNYSFFEKELKRQESVFYEFLQKLPKDSYVSYYLKMRKLISDMPLAVSKYPERFSEIEKEFNDLNFAEIRMEHSGLYENLFESYVVLSENLSAGDNDRLYATLNKSIDLIIENLRKKPLLLQEVGRFLFNLFEKRSLFKSSEYLALAMLDNTACQMDDKHQALFEQYRKMAVGKIAPDIVFDQFSTGYRRLSEIKTKYKLIVFGASWCMKCTEELPKLRPFYDKWKKEGELEIIFVSLDTEKMAFDKFISDFPWISVCDYKSWESPVVLNYSVFATPVMYLVDNSQKILAKPLSAEHLEALMQLYRQNSKDK